MKKPAGSEHGFTLVEVLLGASILTTTMVAIATLFVSSMKVNAGAGDQTQCAALAQQQMEQLKQTAFNDLTPGGSVDTPTTGYCQYVDASNRGKNDFVLAWSIAPSGSATVSGGKARSSTGPQNLKRIDVRCTSLRGKNAQIGKPKQVNYVTYKSKGNAL